MCDKARTGVPKHAARIQSSRHVCAMQRRLILRCPVHGCADTDKKKATEAGPSDASPVPDAAARKDQRKAPAVRKGTAGKAATVTVGKKVPAVKTEPVRRGRSAGK